MSGFPREDMRVLEEQPRVGADPSPPRHQLGLEIPDRAVGRATQPAGSYELGLAHLRGTRNEQRTSLTWPKPMATAFLLTRRTPLAGSSARPLRASWTAAGTGRLSARRVVPAHVADTRAARPRSRRGPTINPDLVTMWGASDLTWQARQGCSRTQLSAGSRVQARPRFVLW